MEAMENILTRRSVRIYEDQPVSRETLDTVLAAAQMAPTWKNTQTPGYIVITTPEKKAELMEALPAYNARNVSTAPVVVVMTTKKKRCAYERDGSFTTKKEDRWEVLYEKFASNTNTYWKAFDSFKKTTVSEADRKIRNFLTMDYSDSFEGNTIRLNLFGAVTGETTWFILRTHGEEPEVVEGASIVNIEEDAYLIAANQQEVTLKLKNKNELYYSLSD